MLGIPEIGFNKRSVKSHNIDFSTLCDWIEGGVLFSIEEISRSDIVDILCETDIYASQDLADEKVSEAIFEIERRQAVVAELSPIKVRGNRITRRYKTWMKSPAYSFCVFLSLTKYYKKAVREWIEKNNESYVEQGQLFEELTKESLMQQFSDWEFYLTGWSRENTSGLSAIVDEMVNRLGEIKGDLEIWASDDANDAGLDLLCYRPFPDGRVGIPVYLMQCASGENWKKKLHTPNLKLWTKVIIFAATPQKACSTPFSISDRAFKENCNLLNGMLIDRYRLLAAVNHKKNWESTSLKNRLVSWVKNRVDLLPRMDS